MTNTAARVNLTLVAALFFQITALATASHAQVVRGIVKAKGSGALLDRAQVFAQDGNGIDIAAASTDGSSAPKSL